MIAAVAMVKDEADIVRESVGRMAEICDVVVVADNGSTDGTWDILTRLPILLLKDNDPAYFQSDKMSRLAWLAGARGADWVVPFDADELWCGTHGFRIGDVLAEVDPAIRVLTADLYDYVATGMDPDLPDPVARMEYRRREPSTMQKVACRYLDGLVIEQGNHSARYPDGLALIEAGLLIVRHYPYRSAEQMTRKARNGAAAYAAAGDQLPADLGAHWRAWGQMLDEKGDEAVGDVFRTWYWRLDPDVPVDIEGEHQEPLIRDPAQ